MKADVLVISAHPDDAELACSGTVKKLTNEGKTVVFVDCTEAEMSTRGTVAMRKAEAEAAARILGVAQRQTLDMQDGFISHTQENILKLVAQIRRFNPSVLIIPAPFERHPDHEAVHRLSRTAAFTAGLQRVSTQLEGVNQAPCRPTRILCYQLHYDFPRSPDLYVDISDTFEQKMESIRAYTSQFHTSQSSDSDGSQTFISSSHFIEGIEARAKYYGNRIGTSYAEAFLSIEPVAVGSLSALL